jgi:hypothetical protein
MRQPGESQTPSKGGDDADGSAEEIARPLSQKDRQAEIAKLLSGGDEDDDDKDDDADDDDKDGDDEESDDDGDREDADDDETGDDDDDAEGDDDGKPEDTAGDGKKRAPKDFKKLAKRLGIEVDELWKVPFTDSQGKQRTLGDLKDQLAKDTDNEARELEFSERRTSTENDLLRAQQDLAWIFSRLPQSARTPEMQQRAHADRERVRKAEEARTLQAIPDWQSAERRKADTEGITAYLAQYGFTAGEVQRFVDHRMWKMLRDSWVRSERVKAALEKVRENKKAARKPSKPAKSAAPSKPAKVDWTSPKGAKVSQIGALLRTKPKG